MTNYYAPHPNAPKPQPTSTPARVKLALVLSVLVIVGTVVALRACADASGPQPARHDTVRVETVRDTMRDTARVRP
jgi:predicted anti-sigma-YlaC factor YlaD